MFQNLKKCIEHIISFKSRPNLLSMSLLIRTVKKIIILPTVNIPTINSYAIVYQRTLPIRKLTAKI